MSLEDAIRQAMLHEEVQAINIFRNDNGVFQANVGYRESGAYKIERHEDPAKALALALKKRKKVSIIADQFEDLL